MSVFVALLGLLLGCEKSEEEKKILECLSEHYSGEFRVVDKSHRGAKNWFVVEHEGRLFKMAASAAPPHHVVEDRFADLKVSRMLENKVDEALNPLVDARTRSPRSPILQASKSAGRLASTTRAPMPR